MKWLSDKLVDLLKELPGFALVFGLATLLYAYLKGSASDLTALETITYSRYVLSLEE